MEVFALLGVAALISLWVLAFVRRRRDHRALREGRAPEPSLPSMLDDAEDGPDELTVGSVPIDGVLDLHHFRPREVAAVVEAYLDECRAEGVLRVRLIHGKGKGVLRRTVHAVLERRPDVADFGLATDRSGWGATLVELRPLDGDTLSV